MAALPEPPLVSVEEYLNTSYEPDVEYVDGVLVARHVGDRLHSFIQSNIIYFLRLKYPRLKVYAEWRSKINETRYRIPDITVLLADPGTRYLLEAPWIAVEILSEGDAMSALMEKLREYARKGTPNIWVIDPRLRTMSIYCPPELIEIEAGAIATTDGAVSLACGEIFAE